MTEPPIVTLKGVDKAYTSEGGSAAVLRDVDLRIPVGEKVSLVGPSGSGKSTLLALISGLLRPDAGSVAIGGVDLADLDDRQRALLRARRIGIALQSDNLIPFLSAAENVEVALGFGGRRHDAGRTAALLERMGVAHRGDHLPRHLSGGEAQRVALAVAVANDPDLLLADEMVAALDADTAARVVDDVFAGDMAVLFVTHDLVLADRADRRLRVDHQRLVSG